MNEATTSTLLARLRTILGTPALVLGFVSLLMFIFGLVIVQREYDRLNRTGSELVRRVLARWARTASADYLSVRNLIDDAEAWRNAPLDASTVQRAETANAIARMGAWFEDQNTRAPLLEITGLVLRRGRDEEPIEWLSRTTSLRSERASHVVLLPATQRAPEVTLDVRYQVEPEVSAQLAPLETAYRRLLLGVLGLSGYSLLCLIYSGLHAQAARRQSAREAGQQATIALADQTCHELGNLAYVLANERRNLDDHLEAVERLIENDAHALDAAMARAGLDTAVRERLRASLKRERLEREIDPELNLRGSQALARTVCEQISVCAKYMNLTVRELDSYLKQSQVPLHIEPIRLEECINDALQLLAPTLTSARARVEPPAGEAVDSSRALVDRRLMVHVLVNLLKNAIEANAASATPPHLTFRIRDDGRRVHLDLQDNGPGIPAQNLEKVFEAGFSTKAGVRGQGLAIVKRSIEAMGGTIHATSDCGKGTCFHISVPKEIPRRSTFSGSFLSALKS